MENDDGRVDTVETDLFGSGQPTDADAEALLTQYRLFVETSETLGSRRQGVNTFFLSVNSIMLTIAGLLVRDGTASDLESGALVGLGFGGVTLCFVWLRLITSFRQLSKGKFAVIHALERRLPARVFTAEWVALGCGRDPAKYTPFTSTESRTPLIFGVLQILLVGTGILMLAQ